jgi:hypothetical protein
MSRAKLRRDLTKIRSEKVVKISQNDDLGLIFAPRRSFFTTTVLGFGALHVDLQVVETSFCTSTEGP